MSTSEELKRLLSQIADIAQDASYYAGQLELPLEGKRNPIPEISECTPKWLPGELAFQAVELAINTRPDNAPTIKNLQNSWGSEQHIDLQMLAIHTSRFWGLQQRELTVSFFNGVSALLQDRILRHMNTWSKVSGPRFVPSDGGGDVRVSNESTGTWSYVGTDIKLVSPGKATTNFEGINELTSENDLRFAVLHQTGHILGFTHRPLTAGQRCRLDRPKVVRYLEKVLHRNPRLVELELGGVAFRHKNDQPSVMEWQFPQWLAVDGKQTAVSSTLTPADESLLRQVYPD